MFCYQILWATEIASVAVLLQLPNSIWSCSSACFPRHLLFLKITNNWALALWEYSKESISELIEVVKEEFKKGFEHQHHGDWYNIVTLKLTTLQETTNIKSFLCRLNTSSSFLHIVRHRASPMLTFLISR